MHLIYAVLAIMLVGLYSMNMHRSMHQTQNKMVVNEVLTQLTGAGYDVVDYIGRRPFDENTDESKQSPLSYPVITGTSFLTPKASFGGCASLTLSDPACDDIDDFDGLAITVTLGGFDYAVEVDVSYVDPDNPSSPGAGNTYAKEVAVTISNPYVVVGGLPLEVRVTQVYTYNRHTSS